MTDAKQVNTNYAEMIAEQLEEMGLTCSAVDIVNHIARVQSKDGKCHNLEGLCDDEVCYCFQPTTINYVDLLKIKELQRVYEIH